MAKKSRKLRGNFRRPVVAAARRYVKNYAKMSAERKQDPAVQIRIAEARALVQMADKKAEAAKAAKKPVKKEKLSKKKGRGNFKKVTLKNARQYLATVSSQQPASKLQRFPFKQRVREASLVVGQDVAQEIIARGQKRREEALKRKAEKEAKAKAAIAKRKEAQAAKIRAEIAKKRENCDKQIKKWQDKLTALASRRRARRAKR